MSLSQITQLSHRFRGYLPIVVDIETGGFNSQTDALLELAAVVIHMDTSGKIYPAKTYHHHILPFPQANLDESALAFTGIDPHHPFRFAQEEKTVLLELFKTIRQEQKAMGCSRCVLVGHNPAFDLSFLKAAIERCKIKNSPFHSFTTFDTATLSGVFLGQTVLAKAMAAAELPFDTREAHSALYDAERTAELFCYMVNHLSDLKKHHSP